MRKKSARRLPLTSTSTYLRSCGLVWGKGVSQGEEAVLADSGRAGEVTASIGRVRNLIFLRILQEWSGLVPDVLAIEILLYRNSFSAAC